jgi:hypothetical protein
MNIDLEQRVREALRARADATTVSDLTVNVGGIDGDSSSRGGGRPPMYTGRRRILRTSLALATAACLIGFVVVRTRHDHTQPAAPIAPPHWTVVPDPTGVFQAPRVAATPDGGPQDSTNAISVSSMASTAYGTVAVGTDQNVDGTVTAAVWTSADGTSWSRVADDAGVFGDPSTPETPSSSLYTMNDVAEFGGILVAAGGQIGSHILAADDPRSPGLSSLAQPIVWTSLDGLAWNRQILPGAADHSAVVLSVAAGPNGWLAVGSSNQLNSSLVVTDVWYSADGVMWTHQPFPLASGDKLGGAAANDVAAFGEQFAVVGSDNGHATAWITDDGSAWTTASLPDGIDDDSQVSFARSVAASEGGRLVALGSIQSTEQVGVGYSSETGLFTTTGHADFAVWYSDDGRTWTRSATGELADNEVQTPVAIASGSQGFVGLVRLFDRDHYVEATIASADGEEWTLAASGLAGPRADLAATPSGWVAVGSDVDYGAPSANLASPAPPENASVWVARD